MGSILSLFAGGRTTVCRSGLHLSPSPAHLQVDSSNSVSLKSFIETRCPSVLTKFSPAWWLFNGHLQTGYCVAGDFSTVDKIVYERHLLRLQDGGTIGVDFTGPCSQDALDPETPIVVVLHGLTGGSYESYVRSILAFTCSAKEQGGLGYRGVVMNFRGCAGVELTSAQLYSAGYTDDFRTTLFYLSTRFPQARLLGIGFSLGANVLTRYLGEEGKNSKLASGCVLACPWDLMKNSDNKLSSFAFTLRMIQFQGHWFSRTIYSKAMANNLCGLVKRNLSSLLKFGPPTITPNLKTLVTVEMRRLIDVDEQLTRFLGGSSPPFPFPTAKAYYKWASSHHHVKDIRVPFLAINALDDPIVRDVPLPVAEEASYTAIMVTQHGGHLGWFHRNSEIGFWAVERWVKKPVCEWLEATGEHLVVRAGDPEPSEQENGYTRSVRNPKIGYKEVGQSEVVASSGATGVLAGL
ncbi:AB-hydrolase YheT [Ramaria rubella]|nr:AB-hydrolase YheT [Ramaria rubella]